MRSGRGLVGINYYKRNQSQHGWTFDNNYWRVDSDDIIAIIGDPDKKGLSKTRAVYLFQEFPVT